MKTYSKAETQEAVKTACNLMREELSVIEKLKANTHGWTRGQYLNRIRLLEKSRESLLQKNAALRERNERLANDLKAKEEKIKLRVKEDFAKILMEGLVALSDKVRDGK